MLVGQAKSYKNKSIMLGKHPQLSMSRMMPIQPARQYNVFMYFEEWATYSKSYNILDFPAKKVTHMLYAFGLCNPTQADYDILAANATPLSPYDNTIPEGTFVPHDGSAYTTHMLHLEKLMAANPHLKVLISIGGYTLSWNLHNITASSTARDNFAISIVTECINRNLSGVDLDWEYIGSHPGASYNIDNTDTGSVQEANFKLFLARIRLEMDNRAPKLLLTAVTGAQPAAIAAFNGCNQYLDYLGIMNYDYAGITWGGDYGHHCNIYHNSNYTQSSDLSLDGSLTKLLATTDIPASKVHLGFPTYGRGWRVDSIDTGNPVLSVKSASQPSLTHGTDYTESGIASYRDLKPSLDSGDLVLYHDGVGKCNYLYDTVDPTLWTLPHPEDFAVFYLASGCAGIIVWASSDDVVGPCSLVSRFIQHVKNPVPIYYQPTPIATVNLAALWTNYWNNPGTYRKMEYPTGTPDPHDSTTTVQGWGAVEIENGIMTLSGGAPRFYQNTISLNTEASLEYQRVGTNGDPNQGCIVGLRSYGPGHSGQTQQENQDNPAHTYYFKFKHSGRLQFDFEPVHGGTGDDLGGQIVGKTFPSPVPGTWYKYKFQCYNEGNITVLKGYINDVLELQTTHYHEKMFNPTNGAGMIRNGRAWNDPPEEAFEANYKDFVLKTITLT